MLTKQQIMQILAQFSGLQKMMEMWAINSTKSYEELIGNIVVIKGIDMATLYTETFLRYPVEDIAVEHWLGISGNDSDIVVRPDGKPIHLCQLIAANPDISYAFKAEAISSFIEGKWTPMAIQIILYLNYDTPQRLQRLARRISAACGKTSNEKTTKSPLWAPVQEVELLGRTFQIILN
jgi:hypothetical protein